MRSNTFFSRKNSVKKTVLKELRVKIAMEQHSFRQVSPGTGLGKQGINIVRKKTKDRFENGNKSGIDQDKRS